MNTSVVSMQKSSALNKKKNKRKVFTKSNITLYLMFIPFILYYILFHYIPMGGLAIAFADYRISGFKSWVGFENFEKLFTMPYFWESFWNTWVFVIYKYILSFGAPIILALLLNEVANKYYKKIIQTVSCLPNFISWVVVAGIWVGLLSPSTGYINEAIKFFGGEPIFFLSKAKLFPLLLTLITIWKTVGYSSIIYLAALAGVSLELYESAVIDGANRWKQTIYITLPSIKTTILVMFVLSFAGVLNLFEPVYVFQNPMIMSTAEVLDTYTYKTGIVEARFPLATAMGLFKSIISFVFVIGTNYLSKKLTEDGQTIL